MRALIWREMAVLRRAAFAAVLMAVALAMLLAWPWVSGGRDVSPDMVLQLIVWWGLLFVGVASLLGCNAFAQERGRREVEFAHSWPASAAKVWAAKVIAAIGSLLAFAGVTALVGLAWAAAVAARAGTSAWAFEGWAEYAQWLLIPVALAIGFFGVGLLMSTTRRSPFDALGAAFVAIILLLIGLGYAFLDFIPRRWGPQIGFWPLDPRASMGGYLAAGVMLLIACAAASYIGFTRTRPLQTGRRTWLTLGWGVGLTLLMVALLPVGLWLFGEPQAEDIRTVTEPDVSPDGEWVVFQDSDPYDGMRHVVDGLPAPTGPPRLWVMRSDGSDLRCISRWPVRAWPRWEHPRLLPFVWGAGPNGSAFMQGRWVWLWDAQERRLRNAPAMPGKPSGARSGSVSPDGLYMLGDVILRLDDLRAEPIAIPRDACLVGWGRGRAYVRLSKERQELWAVELPGGGLERLAKAPGTGQWVVRVSPDGRWIAWVLSTGQQYTQLVVTDMRGEALTSSPDTRMMLWSPWSPDGGHLWVRRGPRPMVLNSADGFRAEPVALPEGWHVCKDEVYWSPDGQHCAFACMPAREEPPLRRLYVARADGGNLRLVTEFEALPIGWDDGGRVLVQQGSGAIVAVDPDTGAREVVFEVNDVRTGASAPRNGL